MKFEPEKEDREEKLVPYFEDVEGRDGWEGHRSEKSIDRLKTELAEAIGNLGGFVSYYRSGTYTGEQTRIGFQLFYTIGGAPARLDIACLPVRNRGNREKTVKMAIYMLRNAFKGLWFLEKLSPGYVALMPFAIADKKGNTISQLWAQSAPIAALLPPDDSEWIEGDVKE